MIPWNTFLHSLFRCFPVCFLELGLGTRSEPMPTADQSELDEHRRRLTRFYQHYCPERSAEDVDKAIERYGLNGECDRMWIILETKFGPESAVPRRGVQADESLEYEGDPAVMNPLLTLRK